MVFKMISILLPVFNSEKYLSSCIESILKQSYGDFELVICNDGSIDKSGDIIQEFASKDQRIKSFYKENESSISKTRNFLLEKVTGEYFVFVDSDDVIEKDFLKILLETMDKTQSDIVACGFKLVNMPVLIKKGYGKKSVDSSKALEEMLFSGRFYAVWNKLIKSEKANDIRFDESLNYGEDLIYFFNLLKSDLKFTFIDNPLYFYRIHPNSLSTSSLGDSKKVFLEKLIELSKDDNYSDIEEIIKVWIYATASFYRYKTRFKRKEYAEYRLYLKEVINEYKPYFKKSQKGKVIFKIAVSFLDLF